MFNTLLFCAYSARDAWLAQFGECWVAQDVSKWSAWPTCSTSILLYHIVTFIHQMLSLVCNELNCLFTCMVKQHHWALLASSVSPVCMYVCMYMLLASSVSPVCMYVCICYAKCSQYDGLAIVMSLASNFLSALFVGYTCGLLFCNDVYLWAIDICCLFGHYLLFTYVNNVKFMYT